MRPFLKRAGFSLFGGILIQLLAVLASAILSRPILALVIILPGWTLVYAGRSADPPWGLPIMLLINEVIYAPLVYLLLYWRPFKAKERLSIRAE